MKSKISAMKKLLTAIVAITLLLVSSPQQSHAQCVTGGGNNTIGIKSGTQGVLYNINNSKLNLTPGTYRYYYVVSGAPVLDNLWLSVEYVSWQPMNQLYIPQTTSDLRFNLSNYVGQSALCASEDVAIIIERKVGQFWYYECQYTFTVKIVEDSRCNLFVNEAYGTLYYKGDDNLMYREWWANSTWNQAAITPTGGWGAVRVAGNITSFTDNSRVFFKGTDNQLYQLINNAGTWTLSVVSCCLSPTSNVCARGTQEVVICSNTGALYYLVYSGAWSNTAIVPTGGWGSVAVKPSTFMMVPGTTDIFFATSAGKIYNLTRSHTTWTLTLVGTPTSGMGCLSDITATENNAVYFRGFDERIHRFTKSGSTWTFDAMNSSDPNIVADGFITKIPNEERVFYKSQAGQIVNLYKSGGLWYNYPLDYYFTGAAGDLSITSWGQLFYINKDKLIHNFVYSNGWFDGALVSSPANVFGCSSQYLNGNFRFASPAAETTTFEVQSGAIVFDVFPNPSNGAFQVQLTEPAENANAQLINLLGERVDAFTFSGSSYNYSPAEDLAPGVYLLQITNNGVVNSQRIVIQ